MWDFKNIWYFYLISLAIIVFAILKGYFANKGKKHEELIVKSLASTLFVGLGFCAILINQTYGSGTQLGLKFGLWVVGGLTLELVGDIFYAVRHFIDDKKTYEFMSDIGLLFIFLGLIMYIVALFTYEMIVPIFIPCIIAMPIFYIGLIFAGKIDKPLVRKIITTAYFLAINVIFASALSMIYKTGWKFGLNMPMLVLIGSFIFFVSDAVLGIRNETKIKIERPTANYAIIILYYIAEVFYCFAIICA